MSQAKEEEVNGGLIEMHGWHDGKILASKRIGEEEEKGAGSVEGNARRQGNKGLLLQILGNGRGKTGGIFLGICALLYRSLNLRDTTRG